MYCRKCGIIILFGEEIADSDGWEWPYDVQVCKDCSPKRNLTAKELSEILDEEIEYEKD